WMLATLIDFYINVVALGSEILQRYAKHWIKVFTSLGVLQGIKLDQCITLDSSAGMFWKVCFFLLVFYFPVSN
ncbi:hypothetical protein C3L33_10633, partial [Rhododendron williamsianum]